MNKLTRQEKKALKNWKLESPEHDACAVFFLREFPAYREWKFLSVTDGIRVISRLSGFVSLFSTANTMSFDLPNDQVTEFIDNYSYRQNLYRKLLVSSR